VRTIGRKSPGADQGWRRLGGYVGVGAAGIGVRAMSAVHWHGRPLLSQDLVPVAIVLSDGGAPKGAESVSARHARDSAAAVFPMVSVNCVGFGTAITYGIRLVSR